MGKRPPKASVEVGRDGVVVEEAESGQLKRLCDSQPSLVKEVHLVWNLEGSLYKRYHCNALQRNESVPSDSCPQDSFSWS